MGWGLSIQQDEDGIVYCDDAGFYPDKEEYEGCPPSSYEFIADGVESYHEMIDMARDEQGEEAACSECYEAFNSAKYEWKVGVSEREKQEIHTVWLENKLKELDSAICVVDQTKKAALEENIDSYLKEHKAELEQLKLEIAAIERVLADKIAIYEAKRQPLQRLESELDTVLVPDKTRQRILKLVDEEKNFYLLNI